MKKLEAELQLTELGELLPLEFYLKDSLEVAPNLLGKYIVTTKQGKLTVGMITETEAYPAWDPASHAYNKAAPTKRTVVQYQQGGCMYMYLIMGLHTMTSIVVGQEGTPDVVFIRSIKPITGIDIMRERRNYTKEKERLIASSSGRLTRALGLSLEDNNKLVYKKDNDVMILGGNQSVEIITAPRVNIGTFGADDLAAKESVERPWRFMIKDSEYLSL